MDIPAGQAGIIKEIDQWFAERGLRHIFDWRFFWTNPEHTQAMFDVPEEHKAMFILRWL